MSSDVRIYFDHFEKCDEKKKEEKKLIPKNTSSWWTIPNYSLIMVDFLKWSIYFFPKTVEKISKYIYGMQVIHERAKKQSGQFTVIKT